MRLHHLKRQLPLPAEEQARGSRCKRPLANGPCHPSAWTTIQCRTPCSAHAMQPPALLRLGCGADVLNMCDGAGCLAPQLPAEQQQDCEHPGCMHRRRHRLPAARQQPVLLVSGRWCVLGFCACVCHCRSMAIPQHPVALGARARHHSLGFLANSHPIHHPTPICPCPAAPKG